MKKDVRQRLFRICSLIVISLFLLTPTLVSAQQTNKGSLVWDAKLYPNNSKYIEINLNPYPLFKLGYQINTDINFKIDFYGVWGKLGTKTFTISNRQLSYEGVNKKWIVHGYNSVVSAKGVVANYSIRPIGSTGSTASSGPITSCFCLPDFKTLEVNCKAYDSNGNLKPGLIKNQNGTIKPSGGFEWVAPNEPYNFCVKLKQGLIQTLDGKLSPAPGYKWINPKAPKDYRVERIP